MPRVQKVPTGKYSPYYGCYIIAMAALLFLGMIGWTAWSFFSQDRALAQITQDTKVSLAEIQLSAEDEKVLLGRLTQFGESARTGAPAEIQLTLADLNQIVRLAPDTGYGTYRDIVRFTKTDPASNRLIADLCMPLKKAKFWEGKFRYLVGEGVFQIDASADGVDAKLVGVRVPGKVVPDGFVGNLGLWPWVAPYRKQEPLGATLKGIRKATVTANGLLLSTQEIPLPPSTAAPPRP